MQSASKLHVLNLGGCAYKMYNAQAKLCRYSAYNDISTINYKGGSHHGPDYRCIQQTLSK